MSGELDEVQNLCEITHAVASPYVKYSVMTVLYTLFVGTFLVYIQIEFISFSLNA